MSFWSAIVTIVALGILCGIVSQIIQAKQQGSKVKADEDLKKQMDERIAKIEKRMANLETVVLQREKESKYDSL